MEATTKKSWLKSKTVWGIIIAFIGWIAQERLQVPDLQLPTNPDFEELEKYAIAIKAAQGQPSVIFAQALSLAGYLVALYGRIVAKEKVTL